MHRAARALPYAAVGIVALAVYWPAIRFGKILEDWDLAVLSSSSVTDAARRFASSLLTDNRPLFTLSLVADHAVWGGRFGGYHLTNIVLHALLSLATAGLAWAAFRSRVASIIAGLLVAVQPAQVMTTAWVGGRPDVLCALWLTLYAWALIGAVRSEGKRRARLFALSGVFFCLSALSKEIALPTILLVPLAFRCWGKGEGRRMDGTMTWAMVPFTISIVLATLPYYTGRQFGGDAPSPGIAGTAQAVLQTACFYGGLLLAPTLRLCHTFSLNTFMGMGVVAYIVGGALIAGVALAFGWAFKRRPEAAWFIAFACLALAPVSNIMPVSVAPLVPSRATVAGVAVSVLAAFCLARVMRAGKIGAVLGVAASTLLVVWWGSVTIRDIPNWRDDLRCHEAIVREDPYCTWGLMNLCQTLGMLHRNDEARRTLEQGLTRLVGSSDWTRETVWDLIRKHPEVISRIRTAEMCDAERRLQSLYPSPLYLKSPR